jgi:hypothetical protein
MQCPVFTGLPGTGQAGIAEAAARKLGIPVFAKGWLEATLIRCELKPAENGPELGSAGYQLDWSEVERVRAHYAPWDEERLILDAVNPLEENIAAALRYLRS